MSIMLENDVKSKWNGKYISLLNKTELLDYCRYLEQQNVKMARLLSNTKVALKNCMTINDNCSAQIQKTFKKFKEIEEEYERIQQNPEVAKQTGA